MCRKQGHFVSIPSLPGVAWTQRWLWNGRVTKGARLRTYAGRCLPGQHLHYTRSPSPAFTMTRLPRRRIPSHKPSKGHRAPAPPWRMGNTNLIRSLPSLLGPAPGGSVSSNHSQHLSVHFIYLSYPWSHSITCEGGVESWDQIQALSFTDRGSWVSYLPHYSLVRLSVGRSETQAQRGHQS